MAEETPRGHRAPLLAAYLGLLSAAAAVATVGLAVVDADPPGRMSWWALGVLTGLLAMAEIFTVRFRIGREVNALNLVEAVLAPVIFAVPGAVAVGAVVAAQAVAAVVRRNEPVKGFFNVVQWALATAAGCATVLAVSSEQGLSARNVVAVLAGLLVVLAINQTAFTLVLMAADPGHARAVLRSVQPVVLPGWLGGWAVNVLLGLLYVCAYDGHVASVVLFAVPLAVLHLAYRGHAEARSERQRLAGLHRAATALTEPIDARDGIPGFLREVVTCFEARAATLVLRVDGTREVRRVEAATLELHTWLEPDDAASLEGALAAQPGPVRVHASRRDPLARELAAAGYRECVSAPLLVDGRLVGTLIVFDQSGVEGARAGDTAVLEALARETAGALAKGHLVSSVLEERRKLAEIVGTTSDGICTIAVDGTVTAWNPALERLTGLPAAEVVGRPGALSRLHTRAVDGEVVDLAGWVTGTRLPAGLTVATADGGRRLDCSYSVARDAEGVGTALVVIARDVTPDAKVAELREQVGRLTEAVAARRYVVEQLQDAVMPPRPEVPGVDLGVRYLPSDESAPTGGDLYDWQLLPDGELHLAVVDVLGHGVAATKDALAVVYTLRVVTAEGRPLDEVIARADELLAAQHPELVATVVVARFDPARGRLRVAAGGHPPALVVSPGGEVLQVPASGGAIGWPGAGSDEVAELYLGPQDALVLYTDGLIEARKDVLAGMEELVRHAGDLAALPAPALAAMLVDRALAGAERRDDTVALVLRRVPVAVTHELQEWRLPPQARAATEVRRRFTSWLAERGHETDEAALVVAELLSNAVEAARGEVVLEATSDGSRMTLVVSDDGEGGELDRVGRELPPDDAEDGRGLFLVRTLAEDVDVVSTPEGTVVRCVVTVRPVQVVVPEQARIATDLTT